MLRGQAKYHPSCGSPASVPDLCLPSPGLPTTKPFPGDRQRQGWGSGFLVFTFPAISFDSALGSSQLYAGPGIQRLHAQPMAQPLPQAGVLREPSLPLSCSCENILAKLRCCHLFR